MYRGFFLAVGSLWPGTLILLTLATDTLFPDLEPLRRLVPFISSFLDAAWRPWVPAASFSSFYFFGIQFPSQSPAVEQFGNAIILTFGLFAGAPRKPTRLETRIELGLAIRSHNWIPFPRLSNCSMGGRHWTPGCRPSQSESASDLRHSKTVTAQCAIPEGRHR